jgi:3'(2'), 5'-bisphosphate nucleotidase
MSPSEFSPAAQERLARAFAEIAVDAGAVIMEQYQRDTEVRHKRDETPVTVADHVSEALILRRLADLAPGLPVISEEAAAEGRTPEIVRDGRFILVDPLDGTLEFIKRNGEFTVNIALVEAGRPMIGVIHAPASGLVYLGWPGRAERLRLAPGHSMQSPADHRQIQCRARVEDGLVAAVSRSRHDPATDAYLERLPVRRKVSCGSSLKFCAVAEGAADLYPRFGPTMEWDTAAGHAILVAAGGVVEDDHGAPLRYGKAESGFRNGPFVARGFSAPA